MSLADYAAFVLVIGGFTVVSDAGGLVRPVGPREPGEELIVHADVPVGTYGGIYCDRWDC